MSARRHEDDGRHGLYCSPLAAELVRCDAFELDAASGELQHSGKLVRLPPQPARVLDSLGHRDESWGDPVFRAHVNGGIRYALGIEK